MLFTKNFALDYDAKTFKQNVYEEIQQDAHNVYIVSYLLSFFILS